MSRRFGLLSRWFARVAFRHVRIDPADIDRPGDPAVSSGARCQPEPGAVMKANAATADRIGKQRRNGCHAHIRCETFKRFDTGDSHLRVVIIEQGADRG